MSITHAECPSIASIFILCTCFRGWDLTWGTSLKTCWGHLPPENASMSSVSPLGTRLLHLSRAESSVLKLPCLTLSPLPHFVHSWVWGWLFLPSLPSGCGTSLVCTCLINWGLLTDQVPPCPAVSPIGQGRDKYLPWLLQLSVWQLRTLSCCPEQKKWGMTSFFFSVISFIYFL